LTSIFRDGYCFIPGFKQEDDNIDDDKSLRSFNAEQKMRTFINYIHNKLVPAHQGNHIILPWGCDFHFQNAEEGFSYIDKLIGYINKNNKVNMKVFYSTPSAYVDALKK